jgi:octaprenyl-diphosphate synthase
MSVVLSARSPRTPTLSEIQSPIRDSLAKVASELQRIVTAGLPLIDQVNGHLMLMKGKMFRPTLTLLASAAVGEPTARVITLAGVVELVHLATLVHDDSVDHSTLRRGMPTVNSLFTHQISVIMGDFLYSRAMVELVRDGDLEVLRILADATNEMTVGEMRQLTALDALSFSESDYEALIRAKTASLLSAACEIGALAGGAGGRGEGGKAGKAERKTMAAYGEQLGMAFQVADDLLDYTSDPAVTGKPTGLDLREHKVTLPLIAALRTMSPVERREVELLFGLSDVDDARINRVIEIVVENGGLEYARRKGEAYASAAADALVGLPETPVLVALHEAIAYVMDRSQ